MIPWVWQWNPSATFVDSQHWNPSVTLDDSQCGEAKEEVDEAAKEELEEEKGEVEQVEKLTWRLELSQTLKKPQLYPYFKADEIRILENRTWHQGDFVEDGSRVVLVTVLFCILVRKQNENSRHCWLAWLEILFHNPAQSCSYFQFLQCKIDVSILTLCIVNMHHRSHTK